MYDMNCPDTSLTTGPRDNTAFATYTPRQIIPEGSSP
jgi:hypothetical protein